MNTRALFDTNELIDWLCSSRKNHNDATLALEKVFSKKVDGFVTSHSLTYLFYITRKDFSVEERKKLIILILNNFTVLTESDSDFYKVLECQDFFDLEDGLQMQCASEAMLDFIVTENLEDFKNSNIKAICAKDFLQSYNKKYMY